MRVCHMTSVHHQGDVRIFYRECTSLAKAGYDVYFVVQGDSCEENGVRMVGIGEVSGGRLNRMLRVTRRVYQEALALDADIYHFHDPELLPYGLKLKRKGKKVIFDSHENTADQIAEKEWIPAALRSIIYLVFKAYQRYVCARLDAVISPHDTGYEYFRRINKHTVKVRNYPILKPLVAAERIPQSVCFAGGVSELWCHETILRALECIPSCKYILCGKGTDDYVAHLSELPAWAQTEFRGMIPHENVFPLLCSCYAGLAIVQYTRNGDGKRGTMANTKIFEEMMAELPIVCTNFDLWQEMVNHWHCGICVDPYNVDEITDAIQYLFDHPEEAKRMGENGRRAVEEEFNWDTQEKKLLALYEELSKE